MNHYEAVNILDMLNAIGEDAVKNGAVKLDEVI